MRIREDAEDKIAPKMPELRLIVSVRISSFFIGVSDRTV